MATIQLRRSELDGLPPVCSRCGAAATGAKAGRFTGTPRWARFSVFLGVLPWFVSVALARQKATVHLPLCDEHLRERPPIARLVRAGDGRPPP